MPPNLAMVTLTYDLFLSHGSGYLSNLMKIVYLFFDRIKLKISRFIITSDNRFQAMSVKIIHLYSSVIALRNNQKFSGNLFIVPIQS